MHLRHGYTLTDLHRLARISANANRVMAADHRDLIDTAWSAIAEAIYSAEHWPVEHDLLAVGKAAIWGIVRDHRSTYGYRGREWDAGLGSAPRFCAYWLGAGVTPSPEEPIVERVTLPRLLAALGDPYREAITALAAHGGDRHAAAAALGITGSAFDRRVQVARRTCLRLWLEHETPQRVALRPDRRDDRRPVAPCGTPAAARRHRSRGETPCDPCLAAETRDRQARRARAATTTTHRAA